MLIETARQDAEATVDAEGRPLGAGARGRAIRLYTALELAYATGMRVSELVSLSASSSSGTSI